MSAPSLVSEPVQTIAGRCRCCGELGLERVLDLGVQPIADSLVRPDAPPEAECRRPLALVLCPGCMLLQLAPFEGEEHVRGHEHTGSTSSTVAEHDSAWAEEMVRGLRLGPDSVVVEANEGGGGVARALAARGARVLSTTECAPGRADIVIANHSLAHALDLRRAVAELIHPLATGGTIAVEFHHGAKLLTDNQFDLICHPHRTYLSVASLVKAFAHHGFVIEEAHEIPLHGGSVRVYARRGVGGTRATVQQLMATERSAGLDGASGHRRLATQVAVVSAKVRNFLVQARADGRKVLGYGAPSRASTLLNHCGITSELLPATVDRAKSKQGWALPGCRVPIHPPELLAELQPDFVLILAWTLADEIVDQMREIRSWGGRFVTPLPDLKVLS
jgi:C-methyltransferase C-terminal domain/Putative zinc binding domain/Methyltransferase domain